MSELRHREGLGGEKTANEGGKETAADDQVEKKGSQPAAEELAGEVGKVGRWTIHGIQLGWLKDKPMPMNRASNPTKPIKEIPRMMEWGFVYSSFCLSAAF